MLWIFMSALVWVPSLATEGRISGQQAAGLLFLVVLLVAISPKLGAIVRVLLVLAALYAFVTNYAGNDWRTQARLFSSLAELAVALCGIWVMLRGIARSFR